MVEYSNENMVLTSPGYRATVIHKTQEVAVGAREIARGFPRCLSEGMGAAGVDGVWEQGDHEHLPTGGKRPGGPPDVQGVQVPLADVLVAAGMLLDHTNRHLVGFNKAADRYGHGLSSFPLFLFVTPIGLDP